MFHCGVIEGFYGRQWTWDERRDMARFLAGQGFNTYLYAPKGDAALRGRWRDPFDGAWMSEIAAWSELCGELGLQCGVGLSPTGLQSDYPATERRALRGRIRELNALNLTCLWILFDDMRGDTPRLAANQCAVLDDVLAETRAEHVAVCPTYYSFDPVLEDVFGAMPKDYLAQLGKGLPERVDILWTGESVLSACYTQADCERAAEVLRRRPAIWDNYPVNDGRKTSNHLHLDGFRGRPWQLEGWAAGHLANPMNQPALSRLPLQTLAACYAEKDAYDPDAARHAAFGTLPGELAGLLERDWQRFQFDGLNGLSAGEIGSILDDYRRVDHPAAREVVRWLQGEYEFDPACLTD